MKDSFRSNKRSKHRNSGPSGLTIGLSIGGVVLFVVVGLVLYFTFGRKGGNSPLDGSNAKLSADTYKAIKDGLPYQDVEAMLGSGRAPTTSDFDTIFGKHGEMGSKLAYEHREYWEANNGLGVVRIWTNGSQELLITFTFPPPDREGRVLAKLFRHKEGGVLMMYGTGKPAEDQPAPVPNPEPPVQPGRNPPTPSAPPTWEQLVGTWEVVEDARIRVRFGADRKMGDIFMVNGRQVREQVYTVRDVRNDDGRVAPQLDLGTVNGKSASNAALGVFWFENGTLRRDPGNGKPTQTMRRVD